MSEINDRARSAGSDDEPPRPTLHERLARFRAALQDRLWRTDEKWAADRGWTSQRSASGWSIRVRDPRFDLRKECRECDGIGRDRITGAECELCSGAGVGTLPGPDLDGVDDGADVLDDHDDEGGESS